MKRNLRDLFARMSDGNIGGRSSGAADQSGRSSGTEEARAGKSDQSANAGGKQVCSAFLPMFRQ